METIRAELDADAKTESYDLGFQLYDFRLPANRSDLNLNPEPRTQNPEP